MSSFCRAWAARAASFWEIPRSARWGQVAIPMKVESSRPPKTKTRPMSSGSRAAEDPLADIGERGASLSVPAPIDLDAFVPDDPPATVSGDGGEQDI